MQVATRRHGGRKPIEQGRPLLGERKCGAGIAVHQFEIAKLHQSRSQLLLGLRSRRRLRGKLAPQQDRLLQVCLGLRRIGGEFADPLVQHREALRPICGGRLRGGLRLRDREAIRQGAESRVRIPDLERGCGDFIISLEMRGIAWWDIGRCGRRLPGLPGPQRQRLDAAIGRADHLLQGAFSARLLGFSQVLRLLGLVPCPIGSHGLPARDTGGNQQHQCSRAEHALTPGFLTRVMEAAHQFRHDPVRRLAVRIVKRLDQPQPVVFPHGHRERRVRPCGLERAVEVEHNRNDIAVFRDGNFAPDPFRKERAGASDDHDLAALQHLSPRLAPQVGAGDIFGLVEKHAKTRLLEPFLEPLRKVHAVRAAVGEKEIVAEHPVDQPRHQTFGLHCLAG